MLGDCDCVPVAVVVVVLGSADVFAVEFVVVLVSYRREAATTVPEDGCVYVLFPASLKENST